MHRWPFVTTVSIDVFSSFSTNITKRGEILEGYVGIGAGNERMEGMMR